MNKIINTNISGTVSEADKNELLIRVETIYKSIASPNISYCVSMNGSLLPEVVRLSLGEQDIDVNNLRFLASNDNIFPTSLENGSIEDFRKYISENEREILSIVEDCAESDFFYR